jgi:hypothetical protein
MKSWKDNILSTNNTIDINKMLADYEAMVATQRKVIEDLEAKNKVLHKCCYTTHAALSAFEDEMVADVVAQMEAILLEGSKEPVDHTAKPEGILLQ